MVELEGEWDGAFIIESWSTARKREMKEVLVDGFKRSFFVN